ncbi:hypothetical protein BKA70DRAFT_1436064 [Coprinopsis sp. MPI-PUGE-AT-0042]|nr:hypothetical protein BKA70DRAFT_1436064 [Coprinopsis sp. MPI-PUGE-AT-0042]
MTLWVLSLLGTNNAKAPLLHDLASVIRNTEDLEQVKVHKLSLEDGSKITLVDFPAFEDSALESNTAVCQSLIQFFQEHESSNCATLRARLHESVEENSKRMREMRQELKDASAGYGEILPEDEVEAIKEDLRATENETKKLEEILIRMESTAFS